MSPQFKALVGLCLASCAFAQPQTLTVYLSGTAAVTVESAMLQELRRIVAPSGWEIDWRRLETRSGTESVEHLIVVKLSGTCALPGTPKPADRLASSATSGERVLPFSEIFCDSLTAQMRVPAGRPKFVADQQLGKAMARLAAHEFYHILSQDKRHARAGIGKPCLTSRDLLAESFFFDDATAARIRPALPLGTASGEGGADGR